jgi:hypothetical protein
VHGEGELKGVRFKIFLLSLPSTSLRTGSYEGGTSIPQNGVFKRGAGGGQNPSLISLLQRETPIPQTGRLRGALTPLLKLNPLSKQTKPEPAPMNRLERGQGVRLWILTVAALPQNDIIGYLLRRIVNPYNFRVGGGIFCLVTRYCTR